MVDINIRLISNISVDFNFVFTGFVWLCVLIILLLEYHSVLSCPFKITLEWLPFRILILRADYKKHWFRCEAYHRSETQLLFWNCQVPEVVYGGWRVVITNVPLFQLEDIFFRVLCDKHMSFAVYLILCKKFFHKKWSQIILAKKTQYFCNFLSITTAEAIIL